MVGFVLPSASRQAGIDAREREVISRGITAHQSARSIARCWPLTSTVSREMSRKWGCDRYRAALADENAWARARRPKCCKLRPIRGYGELWRGSSDWIGRRADSRLVKRTLLKTSVIGWGHTARRSTAAYLFKHVACQRKSWLSHLRSKRSMRRSPAG